MNIKLIYAKDNSILVNIENILKIRNKLKKN